MCTRRMRLDWTSSDTAHHVNTARQVWRLRRTYGHRFQSAVRRFVNLVVGTLAVGLAACAGRGGGQLPQSRMFTGPASFGFSFSCEDKGGVNPPTGRLHIELSYTDHGMPIFSLVLLDPRDRRHDRSGARIRDLHRSEPAAAGEQADLPGALSADVIGTDRLPPACPMQEATTTPWCRFEVIVRDNDGNRAPSTGDYGSESRCRARRP